MKTRKTLLVVALVLAWGIGAIAAPISGSWSSDGGGFDAGDWMELFTGGSEGQPGNELRLLATEWSLTGAILDSRQSISETPTEHVHKTIFTGGQLALDANGPWVTAGDPLPYLTSLGDLTLDSTETFDDSNTLTGLSWALSASGPITGYPLIARITASYAGLPDPLVDGNDVIGMIDDADSVQIDIIILATINVDPDTLNLGSKGKWITCYIEMPAPYDVRSIDGASVTLNGVPAYLGKEGWAKAEANGSNIVDSDADGILERMVKFSRSAMQAILQPGQVQLTLSGQLNDGSLLEGTDTIRVIAKVSNKGGSSTTTGNKGGSSTTTGNKGGNK